MKDLSDARRSEQKSAGNRSSHIPTHPHLTNRLCFTLTVYLAHQTPLPSTVTALNTQILVTKIMRDKPEIQYSLG